jgi:hypothetical protein
LRNKRDVRYQRSDRHNQDAGLPTKGVGPPHNGGQPGVTTAAKAWEGKEGGKVLGEEYQGLGGEIGTDLLYVRAKELRRMEETWA